MKILINRIAKYYHLGRFCDSDGTQTHDLQNRNLMLYSTELPSHDVTNRWQR